VAAQAAETGLALLLEGLERRFHAGVAQQLNLVAGQSVQVVAVDMVGPEPLQAGAEPLLEHLATPVPMLLR
jgi:hypothetical protein